MGKKRILRGILIVGILLLSLTTIYGSSYMVGIEEGHDYLAEDIFERIHQLEEKYPDIIQVIEYGRSIDNRPLYAIQMTAGVTDFMKDPEHNIKRTHYYIDGGNHSRETANPSIVLRMVEEYARDYKGIENINGFDLKKVLDESVLHFIPLAYPDGYNLVKAGLKGVQTDAGLKAIKSVPDKNYSNYKANLRGVDLNRNYTSWVFDTGARKWVDLRMKNPGSVTAPAAELYGGPKGASEPEVKYKSEYILRFDFRQFITFHSRGEISYWHKFYFPDAYNNQTLEMARVVNRVAGYRIGGQSLGGGSGYFSDFTAGMTLKPTLTIETTPAGSTLPTNKSLYNKVYKDIRLLPLHLRELGEKTGYHEFKLYRNGKYIMDFPMKSYADGVAAKFGGEIYQYKGKPFQTTEVIAPDGEGFAPGDVNGDGMINITDLVMLRRHLAGVAPLTDKSLIGADLNSDGTVNITDLVMLRQKLAGVR